MPSSPAQVAPKDDKTHEVRNASEPKEKERLYIPKTHERIGYKYFLDLLDFKPATTERRKFASLLIKYHDQPRRKYLRKEDGDDFTALVEGFLKEHGAKYFGDRHRAHLVMSDPTVGLLYHRDAETEESYLWRTLSDFFHWRSRCAIGGKRRNERPASPDESSRDRASESNMAQRLRRPSQPERESQPEPSVTRDQDQGHARKPLKRRRGRPGIRPESPDGHRVKPLRTEGQGQDHAQRPDAHRPESPPSRRSGGDRHHRVRNPTSPAQSSRSTISPEAPDIPPRRTSQPTIVDLTASEDKKIKPESLDAERYETAATGSNNPASLSREILTKTNLLVRVSNQPNIAPAFVNLRLCRDIETLFPVLIAECDVQASSAMKVTKISVTFPWNREELRLRRGRREDWVVFCEVLRQRWQDSEVVDGGTCKVEMLVHVDV